VTVPCDFARAAAITLGSPPEHFGGNCMPFACGEGATRFQEIYSNAAFLPLGPGFVTEIDFFRTNILNPGFLSHGTYVFSLSTTSKPVNGLDVPDLDANVGSDSAWVLTAVLEGEQMGSVLSFRLDSPFFYDPSKGNLLLDIHMSISVAGSAYLDVPAQNDGSLSRAFDGPFMGQDPGGLVTRFVIPEPSTIALTVIGLAAIVRRRTEVVCSRMGASRRCQQPGEGLRRAR
jgi:hypothetical protein